MLTLYQCNHIDSMFSGSKALTVLFFDMLTLYQCHHIDSMLSGCETLTVLLGYAQFISMQSY